MEQELLVAEAVTLFLSLLYVHMKHVEVSIGWDLRLTQVTACTLEAHGLGAYFLDAVLFLQKLYTSAPSFQQFIQSQTWPSASSCVQLLSRRIGDHSTVTCSSVEGVQGSDKLVVKQTIQPSHLPTTSLVLTLMTQGSREDMGLQMTKISDGLHLLHIINPEVCYKLKVTSEGRDNQVLVKYDSKRFKSILKTPFKLASSLHHYLKPEALPVRGGTLHLVKGESVLVPCCVAVDEESMGVDLQLCCAVALVPHPPLGAGRKALADQSCSHVHVHFFGPAMLPVSLTTFDVQPSLLADWSQYRMTLEVAACEETTSDLVPGLLFKVIGSWSRVTDHKQALQLFVFLEEVGAGGGRMLGENKQWAHHMSLLRAVRRNFTSLVSLHSSKFCRAVHSALDKLIYNYTINSQLRSHVDRVVPCVAEAVSSIIKHSTNQQLLTRCRELFQLEGDAEDQIEMVLVHKLSELAEAKLDLGPLDCSTGNTPTSLPESSDRRNRASDSAPNEEGEGDSEANWNEIECYSPGGEMSATQNGGISQSGGCHGVVTINVTESGDSTCRLECGADMEGIVEAGEDWLWDVSTVATLPVPADVETCCFRDLESMEACDAFLNAGGVCAAQPCANLQASQARVDMQVSQEEDIQAQVDLQVSQEEDIQAQVDLQVSQEEDIQAQVDLQASKAQVDMQASQEEDIQAQVDIQASQEEDVQASQAQEDIQASQKGLSVPRLDLQASEEGHMSTLECDSFQCLEGVELQCRLNQVISEEDFMWDS